MGKGFNIANLKIQKQQELSQEPKQEEDDEEREIRALEKRWGMKYDEIEKTCCKFVNLFSKAESEYVGKGITGQPIEKETIKEFFDRANAMMWGYDRETGEIKNVRFEDYDWDDLLFRSDAEDIINELGFHYYDTFGVPCLSADNGRLEVGEWSNDYSFERDDFKEYEPSDIISSVEAGELTENARKAVERDLGFLYPDLDKRIEEIMAYKRENILNRFMKFPNCYSSVPYIHVEVNRQEAQSYLEEQWGMGIDEITKTCEKFMDMLAETEIEMMKEDTLPIKLSKKGVEDLLNENYHLSSYFYSDKLDKEEFKDYGNGRGPEYCNWDKILSQPNATEIINKLGFHCRGQFATPYLYVGKNGYLTVVNLKTRYDRYGEGKAWEELRHALCLYSDESSYDRESCDYYRFDIEDVIQSVNNGTFTEPVKGYYRECCNWKFKADVKREKGMERE
jgi:hypothetical protein